MLTLTFSRSTVSLFGACFLATMRTSGRSQALSSSLPSGLSMMSDSACGAGRFTIDTSVGSALAIPDSSESTTQGHDLTTQRIIPLLFRQRGALRKERTGGRSVDFGEIEWCGGTRHRAAL